MKMSKSVIGILCVVGFLVLVGLYVSSSIYGARNYGVDMEKKIIAHYEDTKNVLSSFHLKVAEAAQVTDMYRDDLKDVVTTAITAKYGKDGSKAMFQWFKDSDLKIDTKMYESIQQIIKAGRNEFKTSQTLLLDMTRGYSANIEKTLPLQRGWWMGYVGYPKIDLNDYKIVIAASAAKVFETGIDTAVQLRKKE